MATGSFPWKVAARIAWRDTRASAAKFFFVITAVAVGVGSLVGVRGFAESFRGMLMDQAQTIIASDISLRVFGMPRPQQQEALNAYRQRNIEITHVTETLTMAAVPNQRPVLLSAKAVDPRQYPFYGEIKLEPAGRLQDVLTAETIVVAEDTLVRMNARVGDMVRIGGQEFRIAAKVLTEPDRMAGSMNVGLRAMLSREGLARANLIRPGSRAGERFLMKLNNGAPDKKVIKEELSKIFPDGQVIDGSEANPTITRGLDQSTMFLSLVSLVALIVGALGVATAMRAHLQQRLDSIAILKSLGGRSSQIMRIYLLQTLFLGLAGGLLGVVIGSLVQLAFPLLINRFFQIPPEWALHWPSMLQGLLIGILTTMLFTLPTLLSVREVKPMLIFRREMEGTRPAWWKRWRELLPSAFLSALIFAAMFGIAWWLGGSVRAGVYFAGAVLASLLLLSGTSWLLLRGLRIMLKSPRWALPAVWRHGLANLYRPGNHAGSILVALGIGVMFTLTVYLLQTSFLAELAESLPANTPNVFLIDIQPQQQAGVVEIVKQQPGVEGNVELAPSVSANLTSVDGRRVQDMILTGPARRFQRSRNVGFSDAKPPGVKLLEGEWWAAGTQVPLVAVSQDAAKQLNIKIGSRLQFNVFDKTIDAQVASVYRIESFRINGISEFLFTPKTLEGSPAIYFGAVHVKPKQVAGLQRAIYERYPTVTVINIIEVLSVIQDVVDQIALVVRFISGFAILAGFIILASSVAGTRLRRIRETVILKAIGGTRARIAQIFSIEFLLLGAAAGVVGSLLATGFSSLLLKRFLQGELLFKPHVLLVAIVLAAVSANVAGWLASARILNQKPLEVLREE